MELNDPNTFSARLAQRDPTLFAPVLSTTTTADRRSLLALQSMVRADGDYDYLEIGSHLGGTLQPHCLDPLCRTIYSIDKRTLLVADIRGIPYAYPDIDSAQMLEGLRQVYGAKVNKIIAFDCDAREVPDERIGRAPRLCFIDGEHTTAAVERDFAYCCRICAMDGIIAFHDANLVYQAIGRCRRMLERDGVAHRGVKLPGTVYAFLLGMAVRRHGPELTPEAENESWYRLKSALLLPWEQQRRRLIWNLVGWRSHLRHRLKARFEQWQNRIRGKSKRRNE